MSWTTEERREYYRTRQAERRKELIEMFGGQCVRCGATEDLEFDHIDRTTVSFRLSGWGFNYSWERILKEAEKCQLLCDPCHHEKSKECGNGEQGGASPRFLEHGTEAYYVREKCKCELCRKASMNARIRRGERKGYRKLHGEGKGRYGTIKVHGAGTTGIKGCPCEICKETRRLYFRKLRDEKKNKGHVTQGSECLSDEQVVNGSNPFLPTDQR